MNINMQLSALITSVSEMTSLPAATWSSYTGLSLLSSSSSQRSHFRQTLHCTLAACSGPVMCEMCCIRLLLFPPSGVFFSIGMYQAAPKGCAVARHKAKYWKEARGKGEECQAAFNQTEAGPTLSWFSQQRLPVVLTEQCDYLRVEKRGWKILWLSKCLNEHTPF